MKKVLTLTTLATLFLLGACEKESENTDMYHPSPNKVVVIPSDEKTATTLLVASIGHSAKICNGCIYYEGEFIHVDCQGQGDECNVSAAVHLQQIGNSITATTTDPFDLTSEDFFLMPDRSLYYGKDEKGNNVYLNIPEQQVERDGTTQQFTFTGLFFSNTAAYENN